MADKPRKPGRPAGPKAGFDRGARPGERPRNAGGRNAGKPERGPARPRKVAGVDLNVWDRLEQEGLLTEEGRRLRREATGEARPERGGARGFRPDRGGERGPRPDRGGERGPRPDRGGERGPRPDRGGERGPRPERTGERGARFGAEGRGFESVDEQLARTVARGARRFGVAAPYVRRERPAGPREERVGRAQTDRPARKPVGRPVGKPVGKPAARGARRLNAAEVEVAERLHKVMARSGVASRRHSEELIQAGRVTVNGKVVTELGTKVVAGKDLIEVDGRPLGQPENLVYLILNKPKGYVTTLYDPQGRPKVTDLLGGDVAERIYPVGRLDYDTEGLLLLTNDGELANALMHPAKQVKKTYIAKVRGVPGPAKLRALETGVELEDGVTAPAEVKMIDVKAPNAATVSIRIHEGRNRQVRRMFEAVGHEVIHLKRTTLGPLHLKDLQVGQWRELTEQEIRALYQTAGLRVGGRSAPKPKGR
ncbi:MAG: pseudouridine synthase [Bacillota bacterium]